MSPAGPVGRRSFTAQVYANAPVETVWSLLGEADRWKEWSFLTRSDLEREGEPEPDGVGAIRRFTRHGIGSREEVVAWEPPHHLGYVILSGFPVRHYRADVVLEPDRSGTTITWSATFDEKIPGTGAVMTVVLSRLIRKFLTSAARYAGRLSGSDG